MALKPKLKEKGGGAATGRAASRSMTKKVGSPDNLVPEGLEGAFVKSRLHAAALEVAGLGEPSDWEGDMPELPNDIATMDHDSLSDLHAQFTNAYSTAIWYASKAYVEADAWQDIEEYLESRSLLDSNQSNDTKRRAEAKIDDRVLAAKSERKQKYHDYVRFRDAGNSLDKKAKAVSRIGGFIGDEAENEDSKVAKSSTRGKALGARSSSKGGARIRSRK